MLFTPNTITHICAYTSLHVEMEKCVSAMETAKIDVFPRQ